VLVEQLNELCEVRQRPRQAVDLVDNDHIDFPGSYIVQKPLESWPEEEIGTETLELNPLVVRFVWRHAAYPTGWSTRRQQLPLDDFVVAAEKEVACT
jgi:hypothetical protein